jgi:hypothetical protein
MKKPYKKNTIYFGIFKIIIVSVAILLFLVSCASERQPADDWITVVSNGNGQVTLYYVPGDGFSYYDENNILTGVTTEIFKDFVKWINDEYGYEITVYFKEILSWRDFYNTIMNSESGTFGMGNVTISDERRAEIDFSPPYMTNIAVLITNEETEGLSKLENIAEEFAHLRALAFEGTLHEDRINRIRDIFFPGLDIDYAHSNNEIIETVASGNRYFAYVDVYNFWRAQNAGIPLRRHSAGDEPSEQFGYILPRNSDWTPVITRFFQEDGGYVNTSRYREIMETHLGEELTALLEAARLSIE